MYKVSVVVPCYNLGIFLEKCIDSIFKQTYQDFDITIVNDGSTDDSEKIIKDYLNVNSSNRHRIKYIYQENKGLSGARNTGIKNSSGKYIAFLDPDDQLTENSLQVRLDAIERDTSLGVVFSNMYLVKDGNLLKRTYADSFAQIYENDIFPDIIRHNFIFMPTVLLRRDVFESCGFFDESLVRAEDYDMWIRTARYGWKFKYIDLQTAYYYLRDDSLSMDIGKNMTALIRIYENLIQDETISEKARILARHSWRTSSLRLHINSARRSIESEDYNNAKDSMKKLIDLKYKTIKFYLLIFILKISPKFFKKMYIFFYDEQIKQ